MFALADDEEEIDEELAPSKPPLAPALFAFQQEEEEDEEEVFYPAAELDESAECAEAKLLVEGSGCWDNDAWMTFISEVEEGRGGKITIPEVYERFLLKFPRASTMWMALCNYYIKNGDYEAAEGAFRTCLYKCRNVQLWKSYLTMTRMCTVDMYAESDDGYAAERKKLEEAYKLALDNIGCSFDSHVIWRMWIEFTGRQSDGNRRLSSLRDIYQRCIVIPTDGIDDFWKEYCTLEREAGPQFADKLIPEFQERFVLAKGIAKDRKRLYSKIHVDRLAVPPQQTVAELEQLDCWNTLFRYELSVDNSDVSLLPVSQRESVMHIALDQCLSCFTHHPEVWMALASYERTASTASASSVIVGVSAARQVYREAITSLPNIAMLRIAYAEFEEQYGSSGLVPVILKSAYEAIPSLLTFSAWQRCIRRKEGKIPARKCFSDTFPLRNNLTFGPEIYLVHAKMELDVNADAETAWKVVQMVQKTHRNSPALYRSIIFIRFICELLRQLGKVDHMRWCIHHALLCLDDSQVDDDESLVDDSTNLPSVLKSDVKDTVALLQLQIWDEYLNIETLICRCSLKRLNDIRRCRDLAGAVVHNKGISIPTTVASEQLNPSSSDVNGIYAVPADLFTRYCCWDGGHGELLMLRKEDNIASMSQDELWRMRCRGPVYMEELMMAEQAGQQGHNVDRAVFTEAAFAAAKVPTSMRDFLVKLSHASINTFVATPADMDSFLEQLKRCQLPSRPSEEEGLLEGGNAEEEDEEGDPGEVLRKRQRVRLLDENRLYSSLASF